MSGNFDYVFKYIIIGDPSVGKSCILNQFLNNDFTDDYDITVGVEFGAKTVFISDISIKLQIWDTAGQDTFKSITRAYYRGAAAALICYDITSRDSFEHLKGWLEECSSNSNPEMMLVLVGNKLDLEGNRQVETAEGAAFALENNMLFMETSAKTSVSVKELFVESSKEILEKIEKGVIDPSVESYGVKLGTTYNKGKIKKDVLNKKPNDKKKGEGCC